MKGDGARKADQFEKFVKQIAQKTGGEWSAIRASGSGGSHVFVGQQGEVLIINAEGQLFRGKASAVVPGEGGLLSIDYSQLVLIK